MKNPPPERLASIEYRSHAMSILGILVVSVILIASGFWYIIFAFIFGIGVSYSNMMTSYAKYRAIREFNPMAVTPLDEEKSPTRRRQMIIKEALGNNHISLLSSLIAVLLATTILYPGGEAWYVKVAYTLLIFLLWIVVYYFPMYWVALIVNKFSKKLKGGEMNGKRNKDKKER